MPSLSCEEYRDSQQLLALKIRLSEKDLDPEERREIERLDDELGRNGNLLNPGATADLTASVVALATLSGYRP
jgi:triphosphoribosyl-dephospho-CoA synthetase